MPLLNNDKVQLASEALYFTEHLDEWRALTYLLRQEYFEHPGFVIAFDRLDQIERLLPERIRTEMVDYDDQKYKDLHLGALIEELLDQKLFNSEEITAWAHYYSLSTQPFVGSSKQINVEMIKRQITILEQIRERFK